MGSEQSAPGVFDNALTNNFAVDNVAVEDAGQSVLSLADLQFRYPLRRYQKEILALVDIKIARGEKQLHIVAPPGAGKTIIGLQLVSQFKCNSLIICPNTTIQSQWGQKAELFLPPELEAYGVEHLVGNHEERPLKPITLLTYQVLSTPGSELEYLDKLAHKSWLDELVRGTSISAGEAELRILELMQNNPKAYAKEMSRHVSRLRRKLTDVLDLKDVLHANALDLLQALRRQAFGLVIFDECHHLTDYWAAVMTHLVKQLPDPVVIGLTGTPPEGKSVNQENRYLTLVGDIDYQVPTPALVKEGGLAPFQDLVYFTEPTEKEMAYLEGQHEAFHELLQELAQPAESDAQELEAIPTSEEDGNTVKQKNLSKLSKWVLARFQLALKENWQESHERKSDLIKAMARYIYQQNLYVPGDFEATEALRQAPLIDDWMNLLEDYALNNLKLSSKANDHEIYEHIKSAVRKIGYGLTEQGIRKQASPVDRVMAFSNSKPQAVAKILDIEFRNLGTHLRAAIVTDFERMSATEVRSLDGVLDTESGGAIAVLKELLREPIAEMINPCLVTGSLLLVDARIADQFLDAANKYFADEGRKIELLKSETSESGHVQIFSNSSDWETRLYVGMATAIFERGITKCLVGTRGIFGEGWDAQSLNTLIDLTTTTSPVSVKQLRGRSIRINTSDPLAARKVANNWDVVCIAPALEKGLNDYQRFVRKHDGYFGLADDGQIECGVGHVHPSFSELTPAEVFASLEKFNIEMIARALAREQIYDLWKIGQPYFNRMLGCVEVGKLRKLSLTPPYIRHDVNYKVHASHLRAELNGIWWEYAGFGSLGSSALALALMHFGVSGFFALAPLVVSLTIGYNKYRWLYTKLKQEICQPNTQESSLYDIGCAILSSLKQIKILPSFIDNSAIKVTVRSDGSYRVFLDQSEPAQAEYFAKSFKEAMEPIVCQPYLIPKYEYGQPRAKSEQASENLFFKEYLSGKAEPRIGSYHAVPKLLARSEKGRKAYEAAWNKYVSPGFVIEANEKPEVINKYFGLGPELAKRFVWE